MPLTTVQSGMMDSTAQYYSFKNRIINGAMGIAQRATSATATDGGYPSIDRYQTFTESADGVFTVAQVSDAPTGFINSAKITVTTADASIGASQRYLFVQNIEGLNVADLGFGTTSASTVTLSFWAKASVTGAFGGTLSNSSFNRTYPFNYTINLANTWEYKTVTITGDTTGTWLTTNGVGFRVMFGIGVGSSNSGTANAWAGAGYFQPTGAVNLISTLNATLQITGLQLEKGSTATSFDYRPYGTELQLCQRYYQQWGGNSGNERITNTFHYSTTQSRGDIPLVVTMRSTPTLTVSSASHWSVESTTGVVACTSISLDQASSKIAATNFNVASGLTAGQGAHIMAYGTTSARFNLDSEL